MLSSRAAVRALFAEKTDDLDEINLPAIADEVVEDVKANVELLEAFLDEHLRPMVYEVGFSLLQSQRARASQIAASARAIRSVTATPAPGSGRAVRGRLLAPPRQRAGFGWLRQPVMIARGRQIRLESARRHEMDLAIAAGRHRLAPSRQRLAYYALIRVALPDAEQTVGDCLDDERLSLLWADAAGVIEREDRVAALAEQKIAERRRAREQAEASGGAEPQPALAPPTPAT